MYRAVAYRALSEGVDFADEGALAALAAREPITFQRLGGDPLPSRVLIGGEDVTEVIRRPDVDDAVSHVAKLADVRSAMVAQQREIADGNDVVVEGRDIGTVVFPDAALKVYLTASPEERARRRVADHHEREGLTVAHEAVHASLLRRDEIDSGRTHSPLALADDAVEIDTTELTLQETVARIEELVCQRR